jgi:two-component system, chemotaxis family, chemotaxis protein CheY
MPVKPEKRVLLVEDDLDARDVLQDLLEDEGFDVVPAANGKQAIDYLTLDMEDGADLVILDLMMPMISGWEVLEKMTDDNRLAHIPVLVLSAVTTSKPSRAQGFLRKPFALETLVNAIRGCLPDSSPAGARPTGARTDN